jgi:hypothetical protein
MADQAAMSDLGGARSKLDGSVSGDDATYYVEEHESGWRVTYNDAPIGILKDAEDATRFACDIAKMQAQVGRVTWVIVLAQVEEVQCFETQASSNKSPMNIRGPTSSSFQQPTGWFGSMNIMHTTAPSRTTKSRIS